MEETKKIIELFKENEKNKIPVTFYFITAMSKARKYDRVDFVSFCGIYKSKFYQTNYRYIRTDYKQNFII